MAAASELCRSGAATRDLCNPQATDAVELIVVFSQATNGGQRWMMARILDHSGVN